MENNEEERRVKHGAGKTQYRCSMKRHDIWNKGTHCICCYRGRKYDYLPSRAELSRFKYEYFKKVSRKWIKKRGIDLIKSVKKIFE